MKHSEALFPPARPAQFEAGVLEPLVHRGVPVPLGQASSSDLAKLAAAFSMIRRTDRWKIWDVKI